MEDPFPAFTWILLILLVVIAGGLLWWNRKQMRRPRERWDRFVDRLRQDDDEP